MGKVKISKINNINEKGIVYRVDSFELISCLVKKYGANIRKHDYVSITSDNNQYYICYSDRFEQSDRDCDTKPIKKADIDDFELVLIGKQL